MQRVLDAWAMLAWLQDEQPAADKVQILLERGESMTIHLSINIINVGEVYYRLAKKRSEAVAEAFLKDLKGMPIKIIAVSKKLVLEAAQLKGRYNISYADAFAVVTAMRKRSPLVSGDPELKVLGKNGIVQIEWIGSVEPG